MLSKKMVRLFFYFTDFIFLYSSVKDLRTELIPALSKTIHPPKLFYIGLKSDKKGNKS